MTMEGTIRIPITLSCSKVTLTRGVIFSVYFFPMLEAKCAYEYFSLDLQCLDSTLNKGVIDSHIMTVPLRKINGIQDTMIDAVEIVAVLHGHRDVIAYFDDDAGP